jgi:hypothetical protein
LWEGVEQGVEIMRRNKDEGQGKEGGEGVTMDRGDTEKFENGKMKV